MILDQGLNLHDFMNSTIFSFSLKQTLNFSKISFLPIMLNPIPSCLENPIAAENVSSAS